MATSYWFSHTPALVHFRDGGICNCSFPRVTFLVAQKEGWNDILLRCGFAELQEVGLHHRMDTEDVLEIVPYEDLIRP